jgi:hypothetical protein
MERAVAGVVTAGTNEEQFMRDSGALPQKLDWAVKIVRDAALRPPDGPAPSPAKQTPREAAERAARAVCIVLAGP